MGLDFSAGATYTPPSRTLDFFDAADSPAPAQTALSFNGSPAAYLPQSEHLLFGADGLPPAPSPLPILPDGQTSAYALDVRGTISETDRYTGVVRKWVYQKVGRDFGNIPNRSGHAMQRRKHVIPRDPRAPAVLAQRARFKAANQQWAALDDATKKYWRLRGSKMALYARAAYVGWVLRDPDHRIT